MPEAAPVRCVLPPDRAAPGLARRRVSDFCDGWDTEVVSVAVLLTSELVTNAVLHAQPPADDGWLVLVLQLADDALLVEVLDPAGTIHPGAGQPVAVPGTVEESGRGLFILDGLAAAWGSRSLSPPGTGKSVWFRLHRNAA
jgi:anti-sigma regulatory factor (Ser/Thr protein kinase)